jgi:hypothetical protein
MKGNVKLKFPPTPQSAYTFFPLSQVRAAWRLALLRGQLIISPLLCHLQQRKQQFDYSLTYLWAAASRGWFAPSAEYVAHREMRERARSMHARAVHPTMCCRHTGDVSSSIIQQCWGMMQISRALPPGQQTYLVRRRCERQQERCVKCQQRHRRPRARTWRCGNFKIGKFIYTHVRTLSPPHNSV